MRQIRNISQNRFSQPLVTFLSAVVFSSFCLSPIAAFADTTGTVLDKQTAQSTSASLNLDELGIESLTPKPLKGISEYRLKKNGLEILLVEHHETPVVMTTMVFHVGSRNEAVGFTGATHFLEHMMFKGTDTIDPLKKTGIDDLLKKVGGINNATTWFDRTNYFELVPPDYLNLCLKIEADRMRNLLLRESDRRAEMTVVRNELERGEDNPADLLETNLFAMAFREHPYHHPTIGWRSDVEGIPTSRLKKFYDEFYWPDNATLMVIGDFNPRETLKLIASRFNEIPKAPHSYPEVYTSEPPQEGERRFVVKRGSDLPRLTIGFHTQKTVDKDTYALDVAQFILGDSTKPSSRLYKRLIDSGLVSEVSCSAYSLKDPGLFVVSAQAAVGAELPKIEAAILDELKRVQDKPVTQEELSKAKKSITKSLRLETSDQMGLSHMLTEAIAVADWKWWLDYPAEIEKVSTNQVQSVSRRYFLADNRTVGFYYPKQEDGKYDNQASATDTTMATLETKVKNETSTEVAKGKAETNANTTAASAGLESDRDRAASEAGAQRRVAELIGNIQSQHKIDIGKHVQKHQLANGITLLVLPLKGSSTVAVSGKLNAGMCFAEKDKSLVPFLVADLLDKGSLHFSKHQIADNLENMGAHVEIAPGTFCTGFDTEVVKEDLDKLISLMADMLSKPIFAFEELKIEKALQLADIKEKMADTSETSWNSLVRRLYKPSSSFYQKDFKDQIKELEAIKREDLIAFHSKYYKPGNLVIAMVGDITAEEAKKVCNKFLSSWSGNKRDSMPVSANDTVKVAHREKVLMELPDKSNADVIIGKSLPVSLKSPDYYATVLGNAALGFDSFACRLAPVRDKFGLSYHISSKIEDPTRELAPWSIKFSVNPKNLKKAENLVSTIVGDYLKGGITDAELETEKSHLSGIFFVQLRSPKHIAAALTTYEMAGVEPTYIDEFADNLQKVTVADVNKSIRTYFNLDNAVTSISGTFNQKKQ